MLLNEAVSVIGLVAGVAGFVLGVLNYLRDRHKIVVSLQWDLAATPGSGYDANKPWGLITVTNVGRRASYVSHVALQLPKGYEHSHLLIMGGIAGKKLTEGDPSEVFVVEQAGMEQYARGELGDRPRYGSKSAPTSAPTIWQPGAWRQRCCWQKIPAVAGVSKALEGSAA
ncbi:hypothetical protein [Zoogloea sp.]|uniref:hypothetical protein n=1 Tax=Zoogloea sp. TaxID=49181 RepID=UPI002C3C9829|nr:hypothetical protein [Zoogloea sp.]